MWFRAPAADTCRDDIHTPRLRLVPVTPELLDAEQSGRLVRALGANIPTAWPPADWTPHLREAIRLQLAVSPQSCGWHRYSLFTAQEGSRPILIGCLGAFPRSGGSDGGAEVELGYSTLGGFQRQGFGSEAAGALISWLLRQPGVARVSAQSFVTQPESIKVMQRCGMTFAGDGDSPGTVRYLKDR